MGLSLFTSNINTMQHSCFSFVHISMIHARGVRVVFLGHGALGICKSSVCTEFWTSARFIHIVLFYCFLVSERSGRKPKPFAERSALYKLDGSVHPCPTPCKLSTLFDMSPSSITPLLAHSIWGGRGRTHFLLALQSFDQ